MRQKRGKDRKQLLLWSENLPATETVCCYCHKQHSLWCFHYGCLPELWLVLHALSFMTRGWNAKLKSTVWKGCVLFFFLRHKVWWQIIAPGTNTCSTVWTGVGRAELRGNDREGFLFLIQVEGVAQECSSGSESRHPDGRQMLENISEQHVHFS